MHPCLLRTTYCSGTGAPDPALFSVPSNPQALADCARPGAPNNSNNKHTYPTLLCATLYLSPYNLAIKKNQPPSAPKSKAKTVKEYHYPCVCLSCPFPLHRRERESASNGDFWGPTPKRKGRQPFPSPPTKASSTSHRLLPFSFPFHSFHSFHPCKGLAPEKKKSKKREKRERERTNKQTNIHNKTTQEERRRKIRRAVLNLIPSSP